MKVGIVGIGAVGAAMAKLFPDAVVYDEPKGIGTREVIDGCDVAFVCVPTPASADGGCDTSIVESVVGWIRAPVIVIRSTVSVGTTRLLAERYGKRVVFQPEYGPAETPDHPFNDLRKVRWVVLGGAREDCAVAIRAWQEAYSADITIMQTTPETAELCKYMENAFLALKVTFCNEFFELAQRFGVDYNELREAWLLDPRIGRTHTFVRPDGRGFGGRCLPKDLDAIVRAAESAGYDPDLLREIQRSNERFRTRRPLVPVSR
jgi:UDPglucose 6-dehydrogenase